MTRRPIILLILLCLSTGIVRPVSAQFSPLQVKAAFLINFAKFTVWPEEHSPAQGNELFIGIMGRDPFGPALSPFKGQTIQGHPLRIMAVSTLEEARRCHILFIASSEATRLKQLLPDLKQTGLLTVSDIPGFASRGGIIELLEIGQRIRFGINLAASSDANLVFSAHLLKLARHVISDQESNHDQ